MVSQPLVCQLVVVHVTNSTSASRLIVSRSGLLRMFSTRRAMAEESLTQQFLSALVSQDLSPAPSAVFRGAVTSHGEVVYCSCLGSDVVHEYSTASEQWRTLPPCPVAGFGLAVVAGCLTLVGGEETRRETKRTIPTNSLYVFMSNAATPAATTAQNRATVAQGGTTAVQNRATVAQGLATTVQNRATVAQGGATAVQNRATVAQGGATVVWWCKDHYPPMPTKRSHCAAVCHGDHLIVLGGQTTYIHSYQTLTTAEVMDTRTSEWFKAPSLPFPIRCPGLTTLNSLLYLCGGDDSAGRLVKSDMDLLVSAAISITRPRRLGDTTVVVWETVDTPVNCASCGVLGGQVVMVGGRERERGRVSDKVWWREEERWREIGVLVRPLSLALCVGVSDGFMVLGGLDKRGVATRDVSAYFLS